MSLSIKFGSIYLGLPNPGALDEIAARHGFNTSGLYRLRLPAGISRCGTFSCMVADSDVAAIRAASPAALTIVLSTADTIVAGVTQHNTETVSVVMYLVDARPIDIQGNFWIVEFADSRQAWNMGYTSNDYNLLWPDGNYIPDTTNEGDPYTLGEIAAELVSAGTGETVTVPNPMDDEIPQAVVLEGAPTCTAVDSLLWSYGLVCIYDPRTMSTTSDTSSTLAPTISISVIGDGKSDLQSFNDDDANEVVRVESQVSEKAIVPENFASVYKHWPDGALVTDDDNTGRPADYLADTDIAVPGGSFATGTDNATTGSIANRSTAYYTRFDQAPNFDEAYVGLKQVPFVGALDAIEYVLSAKGVWTIASFHRPRTGARPSWAILDHFDSNDHGGLMSRVDMFGRKQSSNAIPYILGKITDNTELSLTQWLYTWEDADGNEFVGYNSFEPLEGDPGSLGVKVDSSGEYDDGPCIVAPIGNTPTASIPFFWNDKLKRYYFTATNSVKRP